MLLFQVNDNGTVYEAGATENNLALGLIFLESQPPSDLIVTAVTGPDTLEAHTDFGVSYTVKNTGDNPANGRWKQALYLSRDTLRDPQDLLLGLFDNSIGGLQVGQVDSTDQTVNFPALPVGAYYLLTETDANGQITEANEENNVGYLPTPVWVTVPELAFSTPLSQALPALGPRYFRVEVPDSLVGETARLTLKTADSTQATNELYVQYGALPERFRYDFTDPSPPGGNRTVIVPELATGTYYGLAYGQENGGGDQTMELEIVAVPFDLYTVNTNEGGNTGIVTVRLDGAKFEPGMEVRFEGDSLPTLISHYQEYRDPAHLYASFDLQGMPLGSYDVVLEKTDGALARLEDGFQVVPGVVRGLTIRTAPGGSNTPVAGIGGFDCCDTEQQTGSLLDTEVQAPAAVRVNNLVTMVVYVTNTSNVDMPVPTRFVASTEGAPLAFRPDELGLMQEELFLEFVERDGPRNVL
ncbi:MAG TPA: hypothetical protein DCP28_19645, partial [Cytophagales bacterium]|nr:hypothetical protein [Cytophagales bacterium]